MYLFGLQQDYKAHVSALKNGVFIISLIMYVYKSFPK